MIKTKTATRKGEILQLRSDAGIPGKVTRNSLLLPPDLTLDQWKEIGLAIEHHNQGVMWWLGDWWNYGEHKYGDRKAIVEAPDWQGAAFQTCANAGLVAKKFETSRRREVLSFTCHAEVCGLPSQEEADALLDWAEETGASTRDIRHKIAIDKRQAREAELGARIVAMPTAKFGVILADPEWRFETFSEKGKTDTSAENHYPTSDLETIKQRDVPSISADHCVLFLWATVPMLPHALEVVEAWGFRYVTHFVWVKNKAGTGYWNRNKHELLLVGRRGDIPAPALGTQWESVIEAAVGRHSEKPEDSYKMIEEMFPNLPKIELNARIRRDGWASWGNEIDAQAAE